MNEQDTRPEGTSDARSNNDASGQEIPPPAGKGRKSRKDRWIKGSFLAAVLIAAAIVYILQLEGPKFPGWGKDLAGALERAKSENRPVLVYFVRSSSAEIVRRMARTTLARPENLRAMKEAAFIKVKVETSADSDLAKRYGLTKLPTMVVLSPEGKRCPTMKDFAGQFIGEVPFRSELLEPKFEGWLSNRQNDFDEVLRKARGEGLFVLALFMGTTSSGETRRLAFVTLADEAARKAIEKQQFVRITVRIADEKHPLAKRYQVVKFPTLLVITPTGRQHSIQGFATAAKFLDFLAAATSQPALAASQPAPSN